MSVKSILVPVDGSQESIDALKVALLVANRFNSHIEALHVVHSAQQELAQMSDRMPAQLRQSVSERVASEAREVADAAKGKFLEFCQQNKVTLSDKAEKSDKVSAQWQEETGEVASILVRRGRLSDVVVVSRPAENRAQIRRSPAGENLEAILMGTGRPLLIVPPQSKDTPAKHVAIGWNESQESARALSLAIPWLMQMERVSIIVSKKREARVGEVLEYLARHGIAAEVKMLEGKGKNVADDMLKLCEKINADILVVGGFSHSRARELLFGGVTRHLLTKSTILTLMVH